MAKEDEILNIEFRKQVLDEIQMPENEYRKNEARRRFNIFQNNLHSEVKNELIKEYDLQTVEKFRTQTSINLVPRVINEQASIYKNPPSRKFSELNENQEDYVKRKYEEFKYNVIYKKANKFYKLQDQCLIQITPNKNNELQSRILQPHHYDVITRDDDPTKILCVIVNLQNEDRFIKSYNDSIERDQSRNFFNEIISDLDDKKQSQKKFVWWSDNYNFITNEYGEITSGEEIENSLGELPFVDVTDPCEQDFGYWVFKESLLVRFTIDQCKDLTDLTETIKMQGFAMGILFAKEKPQSVNVGPRKFMFIPLDPDNPELRPQFDFKNPSPNIVAQMNVILDKLAMFLSSYGVDPQTVGGVANVSEFNSGVQMLLAQLKRFEASNDDIALFKWVEQKFYKKFIKWNNLLASNQIEDYEMLPENSCLMINYVKPQMTETQKDKEERMMRLFENGFISKKHAMMEIFEVDAETSKKLIEGIDKEMYSEQKVE